MLGEDDALVRLLIECSLCTDIESIDLQSIDIQSIDILIDAWAQ